jgi:hypothetical protein
LQRGIFEDQDYPDEFEDIMDRTFAFRVKWQWSWGHGSVIMCKDDKDLVAKIQEIYDLQMSVQEMDPKFMI